MLAAGAADREWKHRMPDEDCNVPAPRATRDWLAALAADLAARKRDHLWRRLPVVQSAQGPVLEIDGRTYLQFCTNNYLGLAADAEVIDAARSALDRWGVGAGASRLVAGSLAAHQELEQALAEFKGSEAALLFPSGYTANLAVLSTFAGAADRIISDKLNHASLLDAARLSGAAHRVFPHRNYKKAGMFLERPPHAGRAAPGTRRTAVPAATVLERRSPFSPTAASGRNFLVTDTVFSMDGDLADLTDLCALGRRGQALVIIDEAHATGVLGPEGRGVAAMQRVEAEIALSVGTLSKALGSVGGFVCGSAVAIEALVNRARGFIYTTAPPAACSSAALAALRIMRREPARRRRVMDLAQRVRSTLESLGYRCGNSQSPIIPVILGSAQAALQAAEWLRARGIFVPAIRPPSVAPRSARLRLSLMATHSDSHIEELLAAFGRMRDQDFLTELDR